MPGLPESALDLPDWAAVTDAALTGSLQIVVLGNPVDGVQFYGPFAGGEAAADWAEERMANETWWVAPLNGTL